MKVTLINVPFLDIYGPDRGAAHSHFFLGIGYIASVLKKAGHKVNILDPEAEGLSEGEFADRLKELSPDIVGITSLTPTFHSALKVARTVKKSIPATVVLGGVHATALAETVLNQHPEFDLIVYGEGEYTMLELCKSFKDSSRPDLSQIRGLVYRRDGHIVRTPPRELIEDLDRLPFPARELVNLDWYKPNDFSSRGKKSATIITSRGCPFHCIHCASYLTMGRRFRAHSPEYVVDEIELLVKRHRIQHIFLKDDEFTTSQKRAMEICRLILKRGLKFDWTCLSRVDTVSSQLFQAMRRAGCFTISFGVESGDDTILKNLKKSTDLNKAKKALGWANRAGIKTQCSFMLGNPGDTYETIEKTINFAIELKPIIALFYILTPYPGTEAYNFYMRGKSQHPDWSSFVMSNARPLIELEDLTKDDLKKLIKRAYRRFYLRPQQIFRMVRRIEGLQELKVYAKAATGLLKRMLTIDKGK